MHPSSHVSGWQLVVVYLFLLYSAASKKNNGLEVASEQLAQGGTAVGTGLNTKKGYVLLCLVLEICQLLI